MLVVLGRAVGVPRVGETADLVARDVALDARDDLRGGVDGGDDADVTRGRAVVDAGGAGAVLPHEDVTGLGQPGLREAVVGRLGLRAPGLGPHVVRGDARVCRGVRGVGARPGPGDEVAAPVEPAGIAGAVVVELVAVGVAPVDLEHVAVRAGLAAEPDRPGRILVGEVGGEEGVGPADRVLPQRGERRNGRLRSGGRGGVGLPGLGGGDRGDQTGRRGRDRECGDGARLHGCLPLVWLRAVVPAGRGWALPLRFRCGSAPEVQRLPSHSLPFGAGGCVSASARGSRSAPRRAPGRR